MERKNKILFTVIALIAITVLCIILVFVFGKNGEKEKKPLKPTKPDVAETTDFTYALLKMESNKENFVYSPLSIRYALSMLRDGANGNTKDEIVKVIGEGVPTTYKDIKDVLSLANSIFIRDTYKSNVKEEYTDLLSEKYAAELIYDKFENAKNVNKWIEDKTFNIIKNMLRDDQVQDPYVKMLLINALAIDMKWQYEFENENTHRSTFTNGDKKLEVAMMGRDLDFTSKYYKEDDLIAVSMPLEEYEDTQLEFVAIMPNDLDSFIANEDLLNKVKEIDGKFINPTKDIIVKLNIPRFDYEYRMELKKDLKKMGIHQAFEVDTADFSNITDGVLGVDEVLHKAKIEFTEKGIKAAAATVIIMKDNAMHVDDRQIVRLNFDKPFMYLIRDAKNGEVWFVGTVYEPLLWNDIKDDYEER